MDAVAENDVRAAAKALTALIEAARPRLDQAAVAELTELLNELASGASPAS